LGINVSTLFGWAPSPFTPPDAEELMEDCKTFEGVRSRIGGLLAGLGRTNAFHGLAVGQAVAVCCLLLITV
jgi:hypothetical protein